MKCIGMVWTVDSVNPPQYLTIRKMIELTELPLLKVGPLKLPAFLCINVRIITLKSLNYHFST